MPDDIVYKPSEGRFEYGAAENIAVCDYTEDGDVWIFTHTFVPPAFRGQGIAAKLVKFALEKARSSGKKVVPACSYVAKYIEQGNEFKDLLK